MAHQHLSNQQVLVQMNDARVLRNTLQYYVNGSLEIEFLSNRSQILPNCVNDKNLTVTTVVIKDRSIALIGL